MVLAFGNSAQKRGNCGILPNQNKNGVKFYFRKDINTILFPFFVRPSLSQLKVVLHWDLEVWSQGTTMPQSRNYIQSIKFTTSDGQMHGPFGKIFRCASISSTYPCQSVRRHFPKVYFLKLYFLKVYFPKVYFPKVFFSKVNFQNCIL